MANLIHSVLPMPLRKIVCIGPQCTVKQCVDLMMTNTIGALVVMNEANELMGIVSERDIIQACLHKGFDLSTTLAGDVVYKKVSILSPHDAVEAAMQVITETKRRHILIYEKEQLLAILSIGDLLLHLLEDKARVIAHLERYIHT